MKPKIIPTFGKVVGAYQKYRNDYPKKVYDLLFSLTGKKPDVLDVGCGTGKSTEPLVGRSGRVFGCDPDKKMLEAAVKSLKQKKLHIDYRVCNAEMLQFPDGVFDAVTVASAYHWLDQPKALKNFYRVLKKNGVFFLYWTGKNAEKSGGPSVRAQLYAEFSGGEYINQTTYDLKKVLADIKKAGFTGVKMVQVSEKIKHTVEQRLNLYRTMGFYARLKTSQRPQFIRRARQLLTESMDKKKFLAVERIVFVCYGFKRKS